MKKRLRGAGWADVIGAVPRLRPVLLQLVQWRVEEKLQQILPALRRGDRILDVGTGNGVLCRALRRRGFEVVALDVADQTLVEDVVPVLYDGGRFPFDADRFDVALAITVLHHTPDPDAVLAEMSRVARRLVVIEEIYVNRLEQYATYAIDSLFNLEFTTHPRSNRTDAGWRMAFQRLGLKVVDAEEGRSLGVLRRILYVLEKEEGA